MKLNQALIAIWLLVAGLSIPMTGTAKHRTPTTAHAPTSWQGELLAYLSTIDLSPVVDNSTTIISFRLDEQRRIQDVIVITLDKALIHNIRRRLQGQSLLNPCPTIKDELGNERCVVRLRFDIQA